MKKFFIIFLILFLILSTAIVKNSTKKIEDLIFITKENLKNLNKDFENNKLEYEYLSSAEKLINFRDLYFDEEFIKKDIQDINLMFEANGKITTKKLQIIDGK